jgi:hypothetical protein
MSMIDPQPAHPWIAEWVKVLIAAVVGFASSVVIDILKTNKERKRAIHDMRVALYHELGHLYSYVFFILLPPKGNTPEQQESRAANIRMLPTTTYDWAKTQPNVFYKLKESHRLDDIYSYFLLIRGHVNIKGAGHLTIEAGRAFMKMVDTDVECGKVFDNDLFKQEVPDKYNTIMKGIAARKQEQLNPQQQDKTD